MPFLGTGPTKTPADGSVDTAQLVDDAVTDPKVADGAVVGYSYTQDGAVNTGTTLFPLDNTTPQNTEGVEFMTLAHTPKSTTNLLKIDVVCYMAHSSTGASMSAGLFQDSTADALAAGYEGKNTVANAFSIVQYSHTMVAGTISETTFKVRGGSSAAGTTTFNGSNGGGFFNGLLRSSITVTEYKAS